MQEVKSFKRKNNQCANTTQHNAFLLEYCIKSEIDVHFNRAIVKNKKNSTNESRHKKGLFWFTIVSSCCHTL